MRRVMTSTLTAFAVAAFTTVSAQQPQPNPQTQPKPRTETQRPAGTHSDADKSHKTSMTADQHFIHEAAEGGMAEVELGKLASEKASSPTVKALGERMVTEHSKANDELKTLAATKNIQLPTQMGAMHKAKVDKFSKLSGAAFDHAYLSDLLSDHQKDIAAFKREAQSGKDPEIKDWAAKTLPTLEAHLRAVQDASKQTTQ